MQPMTNNDINEEEQDSNSDNTDYVQTNSTTKEEKKSRQPRRNKKWQGHYRSTQIDMRQLLKQFVVCSRCGYFLAGYRVLHGVEALEEAAGNSTDGWLELIWDQPTRQLIYKSYGVRPESDMFYFDICCEECQRRLVYEEEEEGMPSEMFRVDLKLK